MLKVNIQSPHFIGSCWHGLLLFAILGLMALTSNNWSIKVLRKNWKRLHQLTYLALLMMAFHVWDKMAQQWSLLTPIGLGLLGITITLQGIRIWKMSQRPTLKEQC